MKNLARCMAVLAVGALMFSTAVAQEKKKGEKKKGGDPAKTLVTNFMKNLEDAGLSAEQKTKIEEMFGKAAKEAIEKRTAAGISNSVAQKRTKATKEAREAGKKGADLKKEVSEKLGLSEDQSKVLEDTDAALAKVKVEIGKLLSEEQLGKLKDEQFKNSLKAKGKGKGKKKKAA